MRTCALACLLVVACGKRPDVDVGKSSPAVSVRKPVVRAVAPPALPTTAVAWSFAEASSTAGAWDAAAEAFERELAACERGCQETAYAVVLARRNAVLAEQISPPTGEEPVPLPPRMVDMVDAMDRYVAAAGPADPDVAGIKFLAASALARWHQPDAIARLEALLRDDRDDQVAEYAANLLLDALMRSNSTAELRILVDELLADSTFLADKDELRTTLEHLRAAIEGG